MNKKMEFKNFSQCIRSKFLKTALSKQIFKNFSRLFKNCNMKFSNEKKVSKQTSKVTPFLRAWL